MPYVSTRFSRLLEQLLSRKRFEADTSSYFLVYFRKSCCQKPYLLYEKFIIIPSNVEFNSKQNSVTGKLNSENI